MLSILSNIATIVGLLVGILSLLYNYLSQNKTWKRIYKHYFSNDFELYKRIWKNTKQQKNRKEYIIQLIGVHMLTCLQMI